MDTRKLLQDIKLIDSLRLELPIEKNRFIENLKSTVEKGDVRYYSSFGDLFVKGKKHYRGEVTYEDFKIKKKSSMFENNMTMAVAKGTYQSSETGVTINVEINGFSKMMIPFYIMITVFYLIFISIMISTPSDDSGMSWIGLPFLILHAAFMFGIPYVIARRGVKRLKYDLERELYFLSQKDLKRGF